MSYALLIPAAGRGARLGDAIPKALVPINGKPLIWWALTAFENDLRLVEIVIATSAEIKDEVVDAFAGHALESKIRIVQGGETRQDSVGNALAAVTSDADFVLVHDAARPLVSKIVIDNVLAGLKDHAAAVPGVVVTDTVKRVDSSLMVSETLDREQLFAVQTPQGIRLNLFREAHNLARRVGVQCSDDVALVEYFNLGTVQLVQGDPDNLKVTYPHEIPRVEVILRRNITT